MLGVIAQSYAGRLAIGLTFFTFLMQQMDNRLQASYNELYEKTTNIIFNLHPNNQPVLVNRWRDEVYHGDLSFLKWFNSIELTPIRKITEKDTEEIIEIDSLLESFKRERKRFYDLPRSDFRRFMGARIAVFFYSVTFLWFIAMQFSVPFLEFFILVNWIISLVGLIPIMSFGTKLLSFFRKASLR